MTLRKTYTVLMSHDLEVSLKSDGTKAVVEGKTVVPFKTFVMLVLQRKVMALFKDWGSNPVIVDSELLTSLAGAAQDSQENRAHLVLVTLGIGILAGVFTLAAALVGLETFGIALGKKELALLAGGLLCVAILGWVLSKIQVRGGGQKVLDSMEKAATLLSKK